MSGDLPFFGQGGGMLLRGAEIPAIQGHFSEELKKTVQSCLARETWDRPTAEQLRDYAEAKLQGRKPVKAWGEPSGSAKAKDGTTGKPEEGKVEPPVTPKVEVAAETARQGRGKGRRNRTGVLVAVVLVVIAVLTSVAVFVQQSNRREKAERERLAALLSEPPFSYRVYPSDANFLLVDVGRATTMYEALVEKGVVVRNRDNVRMCHGCLRVTIGTREENDILLNALKECK